MPSEWEPGPYGAPSYRVSNTQTSASRQRPYADAPYGTRTATNLPGRRSPYEQPGPETLPRRGPGSRPRPGPGGNGNGGHGNGRGGRGGGGGGGGGGPGGRGGGGGWGPAGPQGRGPGRGPGFPGDVETRGKKTKRRRSWKQRIFLGLGVLIVMGAAAGAAAGGYAMWKLGQLKTTDVDVDHVAAGDPFNVLLVGSDTREGTGNSDFGGGSGTSRRADTMMVLRVDPETQAASAISFPRDLILPISSDGRSDRLNSAFNEGDQVLIDTIKQNFGIEINRFVIIDFAGFQRMVDAVGGVPMYFDRQVKDENTGLGVDVQIGPGCVVLDGHQGLAYARSRKLQFMKDNGRWSDEDPFADLGRIDRQRIFMTVALGKVLSDVKSNPASLFDMLNIGIETVTVDPVTKEDFLDLADQFKGFQLENLVTYSLPVLPDPSNPEATVVTDETTAEPVLNVFRGLDPSEVSPGRVTVQVFNGTEVEDQALNAGAALQTVGFKIGERTTNDELIPETTVFHNGDEQPLGLRVARHVTGGAVLAVNDDLPKGTVRLVTGANFTTIHEEPTPLDQMPGATPPAPPPSDPGTPPDSSAPAAPPATAQPIVPVEERQSDYTLGGPCPE